MRALVLSLLVATSAFAQAVVEQYPTIMDPPARRSTGLALDNTNAFWAYGGFIGGMGADSTLWKLQSNGAWIALAPSGGSPGAREQHGLGIHPASQMLVLFGGFNASATGLSDVWLLNGSWTGAFSPTTRPGGRGGMVFAYDPTRDSFLSFGGTTNAAFGGTRNNEVWSLEVADAGVTWTRLMPTGTGPSVRNAACGAIDPVHNRFIIFGGEAGMGGSLNGETWSLDLVTLAWRNDTPTGTPPTARSYCVAAWDAASERMLLYGGQGSSNPVGGAFAYEPVSRVWADVTPAMNVGVRSDSSGATHPQGGILFFGGRSGMTTYTSMSVRFTFDAGAIDSGVADSGTPDSGTPDAGMPDSGMPDAGPPDAGVLDAGRPDAGVVTPDAGTLDAGTPDAGVTVDAGTPDAGSITPDAGDDAGMMLADAGDDAGAPDAGTPDAGEIDAGTDAGQLVADAGASPDAGPQRATYTVGCGCASANPEWMLGLVALALWRRRFRSSASR